MFLYLFRFLFSLKQEFAQGLYAMKLQESGEITDYHKRFVYIHLLTVRMCMCVSL